MQRFIKNFALQGMLILSVVLFLATFAQASPGHSSHHHSTDVVSPFDKVSSDKPLHCLLNAHLHQKKQACPHKGNHSKNNKSAELRVDCGSSPVGSGGASFGSDLPQFASNIEFFHHLSSEFTIHLTNDKIRLLSISIEYPPQLS